VSNFWAKNKWPLLVALLAFLVRLIYLIELSSRPGFTAPIIDELWHWEWAQQIISGSFWGEEAFFRAPLYPYFLAMLAKITGSSIFWTKFLQTILCGGTAVLLFKLTEHIFNRPVAIIAGFFYAFYGTCGRCIVWWCTVTHRHGGPGYSQGCCLGWRLSRGRMSWP
jgi:4-amino-4-deoxy-L-arabinose transferase-like glycosyltransferase